MSFVKQERIIRDHCLCVDLLIGSCVGALATLALTFSTIIAVPDSSLRLEIFIATVIVCPVPCFLFLSPHFPHCLSFRSNFF